MGKESFDVVVIGSGPGGYVAAGRAGQLGLRTALVERADLGGICLNWGCIPTKALLHGAEVVRTIRGSAHVGVVTGAPSVDVKGLVAHSRKTASTLSSGISSLMKARGVTVIHGDATVVDKGVVRVESNTARPSRSEPEDRILEATHIIVATGASARSLPGIGPDGQKIWTYRDALTPQEIPESLVVIGSGAIGAEFASLYADLGSKVTVLEAAPAFMPAEPAAVSSVVQDSFTSRGIDLYTDVTVTDMKADNTGVSVNFDGTSVRATSLRAERVLLAVGVVPNTTGLGLEQFNVCDDKGFMRVNPHGKTTVWGLYGIGDVAGGPMVAHKASHEALTCVNALAGVDRTLPEEDWREWVPRCTYTFPEVASIGITEEQASARGLKTVARAVPFSQNGRALGAATTEGYAQVVLNATSGAILGAHIVGHAATELVSLLAVAHEGGMDANTFTNAIIPHPSLAETVHESVLAGLGIPVNSL